MSLYDEIKSNQKRRGGMCTVRTLMPKMAEDERNDLFVALTDTTVSAQAIARALQNRGYQISGDSIQRHRRKDCACESE